MEPLRQLLLKTPRRLRDFRRTAWQIKLMCKAGRSSVGLADEVVTTGACIQKKWELIAIMELVQKLTPQIVVEIGSYQGGTLKCWMHVAPPKATFISIDLPRDRGGYGA